MVDKLIKTSELVLALLAEDEKCRNSDSYLYLRVVTVVAERLEIDLRKVTVKEFLLNLHGTSLPPFETVRRARQKVQERYPELAPNAAVAGFRQAEELKYRAFARCDV